MHNKKNRPGGACLMAIIATLALPTLPCATARGQVTPTTETAIPWADMGETQAPPQPTKASQSAFALRRATSRSPQADGDGFRSTLCDGTEVWTTGFRSAGATSMSIEIEGAGLPDGGEISVWGEDGQVMRVGASGFSPIVEGEWIALQYTGPAGAEPEFEVTAVYCGFRSIGPAAGEASASHNKIDHGSSAACEVSASCSPGADDMSRAVCRLITNNRNLGTGTLINNTSGDRAPLVLTSAHVVPDGKLSSCIALFGFVEPFCESDYYSRGSDQIEDATLVAFDAETDMAVIRLSRAPSLASHPHWAGWERGTEAETDVVCVHHPYGDTQKVSTSEVATPFTTYETTDKNATGGSFREGVFWHIAEWDTGATEGGSSGSALVNADGRVIGSLSGGEATCRKARNDWFWMLSEAWDESSDGYATLADALDPGRTGAKSLDGIDGTETPDGVTRQAASFGPRDAMDTSAPLTLGGGTTAIAQTVSAQQTAKVWAVRLYAKTVADATLLAGNATVSISTSSDSDAQGATTTTDGTVGSNTMVDYVFSTPVSTWRAFSVKVSVPDGYNGDRISLIATETADDGQEALESQGGAWASAGMSLAVSVVYTNLADTAIVPVSPDEEGELRIRCDDGVVTLWGEAISTVAVYDRSGRLAKAVDGAGRTEVSVGMCAAPSGLYVVRALCESGKQRTFKILNN